MKRILFTLVSTVAGLVALLSFKTESHPLSSPGALPSAGLSETGATTGTTPSAKTTSPAARSSSAPKAKSSSTAPATSKTYLGASVTTRYGIVQVKVTVRGGKIVNVSFAQLTAFDGRSQQINASAAPQLLQETLTAQSAHIDTVSGATYTSDGYLQSLQSALDAAGVK
ncbi:FMN-binding protein [Jatrophihabitans sp.]|uniref:FMN-binding protein n=1 Tax=Jatrophihabitans sp. TaxID=1932789 RepID=UPI0030C752B0|nr:putative FMN-binding protein [Jatrophihabitans sp.]